MAKLTTSLKVYRQQALGFYGPEPTYQKDAPLTPRQVSDYCTWHNYLTDRKDGFEWLIEYLESHDGNRLKHVRKINPKYFSSALFWMARLKLLGYTLPPTTVSNFRAALDTVISSRLASGEDVEYDDEGNPIFDIPKAAVPDSAKAAPQPKKKDDREAVIADLEDYMDDPSGKPSVYDQYMANGISKSYMSIILGTYRPALSALVDHLATYDAETDKWLSKVKKDKTLHSLDKAAYANNKASLESRRKLLEAVVEDSERYLGNQKKVRQVQRKKRPVSVEKKLKNFKFQKEAAELKLVSIDPQQVLGARELWVYNAKYRVIIQYKSKNEHGFDVKGTTLVNFDETLSVGKSVGKHGADVTSKVLKASKASLSKILDELKTTRQTPNGRINENCVLLRAIE